MQIQKINVHGIGINAADYEKALKELESLQQSGNGHYVCFLEANLFSLMIKDDELRRILGNADCVYPDGVAVTKSVRYLTGKNLERISGPTLMLKAMEYGVQHHWRHFLYGGAEGVAPTLAQKLQEKIPGLEIAGYYTPPFRPLTEEEEVSVRETIEAAHPDFLWVGLGGPKQEFWISRHVGKIEVPVMLGVGAAFDFHSGNRPWAPKWFRRAGLEWLFRMFSGGRRTFFRNLRCVSIVSVVLIRDFFRGLIRGRH